MKISIMQRMAGYLFDEHHDGRYMDYYEKGLFNHLLASQDPDSGLKMYFTPTEPGHLKTYCHPEDSFWCCTGTGMENPGRYHEWIYKSYDKVLYVNQYISSVVKDAVGGLSLEMCTRYPYDNTISITIMSEGALEAVVAFRVPSYTNGDYTIKVNGETVQVDVVNGYAHVKRWWLYKDEVELEFAMGLKVYESKEAGNVAFEYGPVVLAAALGTENFPESDICADHVELIRHPKEPVPVLVTDEVDISRHLKVKDRSKLVFESEACFMPGHQKLIFKPFYDLHHERYALYLGHMTTDSYEKAPASQSYSEQLELITLDEVILNQQQSELDHKLVNGGSYSDYDHEAGCGFRESKGGTFRYVMVHGNAKQVYLCFTYWGNDNQVWAPDGVFDRRFTIKVEGHVVAKVHLKQNMGNHLRQEFYSVPIALIEDMRSFTVDVCAEEGCIAGRVFGIRVTNDEIV